MVKVAILGIGVVGGGTAEVLTKNRDLIARRAGSEIEVKYIVCRKPRPDHPFANLNRISGAGADNSRIPRTSSPREARESAGGCARHGKCFAGKKRARLGCGEPRPTSRSAIDQARLDALEWTRGTHADLNSLSKH